MSWTDRFLWPFKALANIEKDVVGIRVSLIETVTRKDLTAMEARMSELELQSRADLSDAISGALGAYDAVVAERDQYKAALEQADADEAAAVAAAVAEANAANDAGDADFNAGQVEKLRRLQPSVTEPAPEPAPVDPPPADGPGDNAA